MINKPNRKTLVEQVAEQMEDLIKDGYWTVGEKIPAEISLMEQFDVSRNTLREAIRALVHAGLLETKQGSGTIVRAADILGVALERSVKKSELLEILDVRLALEKQAAKLAAAHRDERYLTKLRTLLQVSRQAAANNDIEAFIDADIAFHSQVVAASNNKLLISLYEPLIQVMYDFVKKMIALESKLLFDDVLHVQLVRAIEIGDVITAGNVVEKHIAQLRAYITK